METVLFFLKLCIHSGGPCLVFPYFHATCMLAVPFWFPSKIYITPELFSSHFATGNKTELAWPFARYSDTVAGT